MRWDLTLGALATALMLGGCGQVGVGPRQASSEPALVAPVSVPDFRVYAGKTYAEFTAEPGMERYSVAGLGFSHDEQIRFNHSMATPAAGLIATGGGAEALVFSGCAPTGCLEGLSVVAIDLATGEAFVGVSDSRGAEELTPNDKLEVLLRLTSPSQTWDDPLRPATQPG